MNKQSFEEYLKNHDRLIYRNTGTSMLPLLKQGRDFFIVEKLNNRPLKKYDVVLYATARQLCASSHYKN